MQSEAILDELTRRLEALRFGPPVTHVYNPLVYARQPLERYLRLYGSGRREVLLLGMNPGPWGMAQTGVPFGDAVSVRDWLRIREPVGAPARPHPKRPVLGLACPRREVSGKRLWGWAETAFGTPERFFSRFLVLNYCPLLFLEASGRNRTPDKLAGQEREPLFAACDHALRRTVEDLKPGVVVGIGRFAEERARLSLTGFAGALGRITHPSPANPRANRDWEGCVREDLAALGIRL